MLGLLRLVADVVTALPTLVLWAIESGLNATVAGVAAAATALLALLPSLPDAPALGTPDWLKWLNWVYPLGTAVTAALGLLLLYVALLVLRIALRWVKAL
jgi:hypothetical protein